MSFSVADPGFPIGGGALTHWGGTNLRCIHFLAKMYVKTKEIDPVGGGGGTCWWHPPGSANDSVQMCLGFYYATAKDILSLKIHRARV